MLTSKPTSMRNGRRGPDAVVIGSGPNGLAAANVLADAGWHVVVVEEQAEPGGTVRSGPGPAAGFVADHCAAFFPAAAASRAFARMNLERHGLRWTHAPTVLAHPLPEGRAALLYRDVERTAKALEDLTPGDGDAWARLHTLWAQVGPRLLDSLFVPFPPVRAGLRLGAGLGPAGAARFARFAALPARRLLEEEFAGPGGLLLAGTAMHTDLLPEAAGSAMFGWFLAMLGHDYGWPVPVGGAQRLADALVARLKERGGEIHCGDGVREIVVRNRCAIGVRTASGIRIPARRAVLAATSATQVYGGMVGWEHLPAQLADDMRRFHWDFATVKVDWAVRSALPWAAPAVGEAGTVHISESLDEISEAAGHLARGLIPARPFVLLGQMTTADAERSPAGTQALWGYSHVPHRVRGDAGGSLTGAWNEAECNLFADRMEQQIEAFAPRWRDRILARRITGPPQMEADDANLVDGAINGGTSAVHQQLIFRPVPGTGRPETPIAGLYLASSSVHPGGAVHGAPGANAARAALRADRLHTRRLAASGTRLMYRS